MKWNEPTDWKSFFKTTYKTIGMIITVIGVLLGIGKVFQYWDGDPDRGAHVFNENAGKYNDAYDTVFPSQATQKKWKNWQGWTARESMWFYTTTQGSNLIPYDFFLVLEEAKSEQPFLTNKRMDGYRYITLKPTHSNPDGLPLGFVKDEYKGMEYVGLTCAACHTGQINSNGIAMRIDGAPAMADMETFIDDLSAALEATEHDSEKKKRFVKKVMDRNSFWRIFWGGRNYGSEEDVEEDLHIFANRLLVYRTINKSEYYIHKGKKNNNRVGKHFDLKYGPSRLDAFGRIFNRTLQHVLTRNNLEEVLKTKLGEARTREVIVEFNDKVLSNDAFDHILDRLRPLLTDDELLIISDELFNSPNAPVSYPYMWDVPQHDYLQTNGIAANAGLGPLGRNSGEVVGVFGTLDWQEKESWQLTSFLMGTKKQISFASSINFFNLPRLENSLTDLYSPPWPVEVFKGLDDAKYAGWKIDHNKVAKGRKTFLKYGCNSCHHDLDSRRSDRKVVASFTNLDQAGVDTTMALNALTYTGYSGILFETYMSAGPGNLVIPKEAPVALTFTSVVRNVIASPDPDKSFLHRWFDRAYNFGETLFHNEIKESLRAGSYPPATTNGPFNELKAYKSRPLNGIWATAPYLHNGSVPTLYHLLLPSSKDVKAGKVKGYKGPLRPDKFMVGSREFDPVKVGFIYQGFDGFEFDTSLYGNSNEGHLFGVDKMTDDERWALVEYLKWLGTEDFINE